MEITEVETRMTTYFWFVLLRIINGRLFTGSTNLIWRSWRWVSGKGHMWPLHWYQTTTDTWIMHLPLWGHWFPHINSVGPRAPIPPSPHSSAAYGQWQETVTNPAVCHDKLLNQQFAACAGSPYDDKIILLVQQLRLIVLLLWEFLTAFSHVQFTTLQHFS